MRVNVKKRSAINAVTFPYRFAKITDADNEAVTYRFSYSLDVEQALAAGGVCLEMAILSKNETEQMNIFAPDASLALTPEKLIDNILKKPAVDMTKVSEAKSTLAKKEADFTAFVSNDTQLRKPQTKKVHKYVSAKSINDSGQKKSIIPTTLPRKPEGTFVKSYKAQANKMVQTGKDPASVVVEAPTTQVDMLKGTKRLTAKPKVQALYAGIIQQTSARRTSAEVAASGEAKIVVVENTVIDRVSGHKVMKIMNSLLGSRTQFYLRVRLLGQRGKILSEQSRLVKHSSLIKEYLTPRTAPIVSASTAIGPGANLLSLKQCDPVGESINIYRKNMHSQRVDEGYTLIGNVVATKDSPIATFRDLVDNSSPLVYRAVAVGSNGTQGANFGSVVAMPPKRPFSTKCYSDHRANAALDAIQTDEGILVRAYNYHDDVVAVQFLRKNIFKKERNWSTFNNDLLTRAAVGSNASTIDTDLHSGNVYEYTARLSFRDGSTMIANSITTIKHERIFTAQVTIEASPPEVDARAVNVKFNVARNIQSTAIDSARQLIQKQGLAAYFNDELKNERTLLNQLVVVRVERVHLDTGDIENLGLLIEDELDNNALAANTAARALQPGGRYRYVLYTYQRKPETVFDKHVEKATYRGREYLYSPAKYKSPQALRESTIITQSSRGVNSPSLLLGDLVSIDNIDVTMPPRVFSIDIATMRRTDEGNDIQWTVAGDRRLVDHFVVFARRFETTEPVATIHAHATPSKNVFRFNDTNGDDVDAYEIVTVLNDYSTMPATVAKEEDKNR